MVSVTKHALNLFVALGLLLDTAGAAWAQGSYPSRAIRLVVPSSAGGSHDIIARLWADRLKDFGTILIENRGGAGTIIGTNEVAKAAPDGYTLLLGSNSTHILQPQLTAKPTFDPVKDFEVVTVFATTSTVVAVNPNQPFKTLQEMIEYAKANPGKLAFGHGGPGGSTHVTGELFKQLAGVEILQVSYRGLGPATTGFLSGDVHVLMANITNQVLDLGESGKMRLLSVNSPTRHDSVPNVPTSIEAGLPGMVSQSFFGIFAPAGTPKEYLERLNNVSQQAMADPLFRKKMADAGFEPLVGYGPDRAAAYMLEEHAKWAPVTKLIGPKE
jgi:tripartite-type tricarboxylate transporter receptor subunit TctC